MKSVIERLRDLREDHDRSQSQIAGSLGISQQHYSKYETGEYELPLRHFITLAEYYGVSADYLIGRCDFDSKAPAAQVYLTRDCSCEDFLRDALSLSEHGREAVVEYLALQKLKESQEGAPEAPR